MSGEHVHAACMSLPPECRPLGPACSTTFRGHDNHRCVLPGVILMMLLVLRCVSHTHMQGTLQSPDYHTSVSECFSSYCRLQW